jgi:hypothetical protein
MQESFTSGAPKESRLDPKPIKVQVKACPADRKIKRSSGNKKNGRQEFPMSSL